MKRISLTILFVFFFVLVGHRILAQDAIVTAEPTPVTAPAPAPTLPPSTDPQITLSLWQLLAGIASAFSLGGLTIGTGMAVMASRLRHNPTAMAAIEGLAASTPDKTVQLIAGFTDKFQAGMTEVFGLVREALDNKPAASKTPEEREAVLQPGSLSRAGETDNTAAFRSTTG